MKGELKVPPSLMREYHQFDGARITVRCGSGGFAPSSVYMPRPARRATTVVPTDWVLSTLSPSALRFQLTHMREYDDTLVYELVIPRIVD